MSLACESVWLPRVCPRAEISFTRPGQARANFPIRKNVARTEWRSNNSSSLGVTAGFGPSSKVSAIFPAELVCRTVGPYNSDQGATAPQAPIPAAAATPDDSIPRNKFEPAPRADSRTPQQSLPAAG